MQDWNMENDSRAHIRVRRASRVDDDRHTGSVQKGPFRARARRVGGSIFADHNWEWRGGGLRGVRPEIFSRPHFRET